MANLNSAKHVAVICFAVLCLAYFNSAVGRAQEGKATKDIQEEFYKQYWTQRFGSEARPLNTDILEQRCIEEFRQNFAILHFKARHWKHYQRVLGIWNKCVTERSRPTLTQIINICWSLHRTQHKEIQNLGDVDYRNLWTGLSELLLKLERGKEDSAVYEQRALIAMTTDAPIKLEPQVVQAALVALGANVRAKIYDILLKGKVRSDIRVASLLRTGRGIANQPEIFRPSDNEISKMLNSGHAPLIEAVKDYASSDRPTHAVALELTLADLASSNSHNVARAINRLAYYISDAGTLDQKQKDILVKKLDERIKMIEREYSKRNFKIIEAQTKGGFGWNRLPEFLGPDLVAHFLLSPMGTGWGAQRLLKQHGPMLLRHASWLERVAQQIGAKEGEEEVEEYLNVVKLVRESY